MMRLAFALVWLGGCVVSRQPGWFATPVEATSPGTLGEAVYDEMIKDGERAYSERVTAARLDDALNAFRAALRYRPDDARLLVDAARASLARGASKFGDKGLTDLAQAVAWSERALAVRNGKLSERAGKNAPPHELFALAEPADAPAVVAYAESLFAWADRAGTPTLMREQDRIRAAAQRAFALDRSLGHGAAERVLGALECSLPNGVGADLERAREHFEGALADSPGYLPSRVEYAQRWAARMRDERVYRRLLDEVLAANADALPDAIAENRQAQADAKKLIGR
jgi:hypothetical protein